MHSGYPNMKAEVIFDGWGNQEEIPWKDIRLLEAGTEDEESEEESEGEEDGGREGRKDGGRREAGSAESARPLAVWDMPRGLESKRNEEQRRQGGEEAAGEGGGDKKEGEEEEEEGLLHPALVKGTGRIGAEGKGGGGWKARAAAAKEALRQKQRLQETVGAASGREGPGGREGGKGGETIAAIASKLADEVEKDKVTTFLQNTERPKLSMSFGRRGGMGGRGGGRGGGKGERREGGGGFGNAGNV